MRTRTNRSVEDDGTLLTTPRGSVMQCECCDKVEVMLGNAILSLDFADLDSVLEVIESFDVDSAPERTSQRRSFIIRTETDQAAFAFDRDEVIELRELVTCARARVRPAGPLVLPLPSERRQLLH